MPKVIGHTPPWLSNPSAGARIFSDPAPKPQPHTSPSRPAPESPALAEYHGPTRLVAYRGREIFAAVGRQIRWADLARVKDNWEQHSHGTRKEEASEAQQDDNKQAYCTLSTTVFQDIRQLVIAPSGCFLAICTEHTIYVAVLPDSSRLTQLEGSTLRLKAFQLGPTTHVVPESPLASVLWHPLAPSTPSSDCLVTVTAEAAVRLWEIDRTNQWSFDRPALAIDLRKLADGVSSDQDFEPSGFGMSRGFSVDEIDMEVAASCFGGQGREDEDAWASMTLWTAMRNGDIYALCPLLPSKWCPTTTTIPSLSTSAVSRMATIAAEDADPDEHRAADQQYEWVQEIDDEEIVGDSGLREVEVRRRPQNPSAIPRLQGPFDITFDHDNIDADVTDLIVFASRLDENDLYSGEDDYEAVGDLNPNGLPFTIIAIATSDCQIHIALDVEGVSGQWLPKKGRSTFSVPTSDAKELALIQSLRLGQKRKAGPRLVSFSSDPIRPYSAFVSDGYEIHSISLDDWAVSVAEDMSGEVDSGLKTRLETSCKSQVCVLDDILSKEGDGTLSAPVILDDTETGYFLLTASRSQAFAVSFDQPRLRLSALHQSPVDFAKSQNLGQQLVRFEAGEESATEPVPTRPIYAPPKILYYHPEQPINQFVQKLPMKQKTILKEQPMRLSPAILDIITSAHRTISRQTTELENAAAELFRRCDRLREELHNQVKQMSELADRLQRLRSGDEDDYSAEKKERKSPDDRLKAAKERQAAIMKRYEALRIKVGRVGLGKKELSAKEVAWVAEIEALNNNVGEDANETGSTGEEGSLVGRYHSARQLKQQLLEESRRLQERQEELSKSTSSLASSNRLERSDSTTSRRSVAGGPSFVSSRYQREKIAEVMASVEREGAIIDAVMGRLEKLEV